MRVGGRRTGRHPTQVNIVRVPGRKGRIALRVHVHTYTRTHIHTYTRSHVDRVMHLPTNTRCHQRSVRLNITEARLALPCSSLVYQTVVRSSYLAIDSGGYVWPKSRYAVIAA